MAFVYSITGQFGLPAGTLLELPNPDPIHGGFSAAFDVNEQGLIVGSVGGVEPTQFFFTDERAAVWRLEAGVSPTLAIIAPPSASEFTAYGQGGFGRLESVSSSAGGETWAAGHFGLAASCGFGFGSPRYAASAARIDLPSVNGYRWDSQSDHPRGSMRAISEGRSWMAGLLLSCGTVFACEGNADSLGWGWTFAPAAPSLEGYDRNPDVFGGNSFSAARVEAVLDDGSAVGRVFDRELDGGICASQAFAWEPGLSNAGAVLLDINQPNAPEPPDGFKGYWANDVAQLASPLITGRLAVGAVVLSSIGDRGALWFRPDSAAGWTTEDWQYRRVRSMVSPLKSETETLRVVELHGVNRFGDCVGIAEVVETAPDGPVTRRAVLLRSVPVACVGDLNRDGSVGPADLTMLLSYWCNGPSCASAAAIADLNVDGQVGAADLTIFLANWGGPCSWPVCSSLADEVPESAVQLAMESVDFAAQFVGLSDFAGYRAWRDAAPAPIVRIFDEVVWTIAKGGL